MYRIAIALLLAVATCSFAQAGERIALLIGNQNYDPSVGALKNPHNDIALVGQALAAQGFEVLPPIKDARRSTMLGAVRNLAHRLNAAGSGAIGFIYYSGHGAAEKDTNINYLIPVDAKEPGTTIFWDESLKLDDVLRLLDGARGAAKFVVFDACRTELLLPTKETTKGLVPVAEQQGMFIAYASAPGRTASDRGGNSGPYAAALAVELGKPGLDHLNLFQNVKEAVLASTGGAQQPWESNGLARRVYLTGQGKPAEPAPVWRLSEAAEAWDRIKNTTSIPVLEEFVGRHKNTLYAELARSRIAELKKQQAAIPPPPRPSPPFAVPSYGDGIVGVWIDHTGRGGIEIYQCGTNLCGRIAWLQVPNKNACGVQVIGDVKPIGKDIWDQGWILDADKNAKYSVELKRIGKDKLKVLAYMRSKFVSEGMTWTRAPADLAQC